MRSSGRQIGGGVDMLPPVGMADLCERKHGTTLLCHCEERSDEAISIRRMVDCFAALQMRNILFFSKHFWLRPQAALRSQ